MERLYSAQDPVCIQRNHWTIDHGVTADKAANLDLYLAFMAFRWRGFFYVPHLLRHVISPLKILYERPVIVTSTC
jgi:hypothetical protein